jgi:hypothetical protein
MKSFIALLIAAVLACAAAVPALAVPADNGPRTVAHVKHAAPTAPANDDGTPAFVYVLIGVGAFSLGAAGYMGARFAVTRQVRVRAN